MKTALTIAGSDSSGGAGIQADIKTMTLNGVFAMSAITALTAQNTMGVTAIMDVTPEFLAAQIDAVFADIRPDAVKIGMVSSPSLVFTIADRLRHHEARNVVLDPVMVATSGARLIDDAAVAVLEERLIPLADVITPNIPEAEVLSDLRIKTAADLLAAAERYIRDADVQTEEASYADVVTLALLVPTGDIELHQRALTDLTAGRARYRLGAQRYVAVPLA